jgi:hypothetical protein
MRVITPANHQRIFFLAQKITTLTLGELGGRVLFFNGDSQTYTLERQPKGGSKSIWFV